jgi:hypothetical protein
MFLETVPASEGTPPVPVSESPRAEVTGEEAVVNDLDGEDGERGLEYRWHGSVALPEVQRAELKILVEGPPDIASTTGRVLINGRQVRLTRKGSAGQFGAAVEASPDNWTRFIAPLSPGEHDLEVTLAVPFEKVSVGIYVTGALDATSDTAEEGEPAFPVFQPDQRPWSQTLQPLKVFVSSALALEGASP